MERRPGRPRLVEEGKPLTDSLSSDNDENDSADESMEMDHHSSSERRSTLISDNDITNNSSSSSSLLKALGGKIPAKPRPMRSMRFEIGGGPSPPRQSQLGENIMEYDPTPEMFGNRHVEQKPLSQQSAYSFVIPDNNLHPFVPKSASMTNGRPYSVSSATRTHYEVGADYRPTERMEGVEDHSVPLPLVVIDGANVAYAYANAREEHFHRSGKIEPDVRGLSVACSYFSHVRVRVVLPASFMRAKPRAGDTSRTNAWMETDRFDILQNLQQQGKLVASPPTDDDDAYCLTIAQRENLRALQTRQGQGPAFVLSNDMFRDAQERDSSGQLKEWLTNGDRPETGAGRISYTFVDLDRKDDYGDPIFDIVPNPRHPLISWIEDLRQQQGSL